MAVLNDLRPSKDEGQSNFMNPGTVLAGLGLDADVLPTLRASFNFNSLWFATTEPIESRAAAGQCEQAHRGTTCQLRLPGGRCSRRTSCCVPRMPSSSRARVLDGLYPQKNPRYVLLNAVLAF